MTRGDDNDGVISFSQFCISTTLPDKKILCCMVSAMPMIDKDKSLCWLPLPGLRDTKFYWKLTFITGKLSSFSVRMTNLRRSIIYGQARKENLYQRVMSCKSSFIFSRRNDQRNRRLPANDDEIRSSSRSLSFSLEQSRSCSSSEGNGQIMKGCSI